MSEGKKDKIIYKELSYKIVGCFYKVYNTLGPGHKESVYQKAISIEFDKQKIHSQQQKKIQLKYEGEKVGVYEPDFIVEGKIIVEIKSTINMPKVFEKQLYYYLKATDYSLGYLVNFGTSEIDIRRRVL
ncbi:MAG: GxxExxY protein [Candidatus Omnitrophota bacterium]